MLIICIKQVMIKKYLVVSSLPQTFWNRWEILIPIFKGTIVSLYDTGWYVFSYTLSCVTPDFVLTESLSFLGAMSTFVIGKLP